MATSSISGAVNAARGVGLHVLLAMIDIANAVSEGLQSLDEGLNLNSREVGMTYADNVAAKRFADLCRSRGS